MKEKDYNRKKQLKKERQQLLLRKALHHDICLFLADVTAAMTENKDVLLNSFLVGGFRGFERWRGKDLVKAFGKYYEVIRDVKKPLPMYYKIVRESQTSRWSHPYGHWNQLTTDRHKQNAHEELMLQSDALLSRLMELAFDLDIDE